MISSRLSKMIAASLFLTLSSQSAAAKDFTFTAISDMPYGSDQEQLLDKTIIPAMLKSSSPFIIHLGDIKSGAAACSNTLLKKRHAQIMRMHPEFVFYTPGDNDWTACDRKKTGQPISELEALDTLRRLFFTTTPPFPESWQVRQQALYPENKRWIYNHVAFATVHLVGTNNGRRQIDKDNKAFALAQVSAREVANIVWIKDLFKQATKQKNDAVIIATQADVEQFKHSRKCDNDNPVKCDAFATFKKQLRKLAAKFAKPVLLLHGDSSPYCIDKKFGREIAPQLWRFNAAGDFKILDAVKITVSPQNVQTPFQMESLSDAIKPDSEC